MANEKIDLEIQQLRIEIENLKTEIEKINAESRQNAQDLQILSDDVKRLPSFGRLNSIRNKKENIIEKRDSELLPNLKEILQVESYQIGSYTLYIKKRQLHFQDDVLTLTRKEMYLLVLFAANQNVFMERDYCLTTIWLSSNYKNSRSMDVYICKLRKYLLKDSKINLINKHGKGYLMLVEK